MLFKQLQTLQAQGKPIKVGAYGAGWMGSGFAAQLSQTPGMDLAILADADVALARQTLIESGVAAVDIVEASTPVQAQTALEKGKRVITADPTLASQVAAIDLVTDVTPDPTSGAEVAYSAIQHGKDVVLINIEADVTVGRILKKKAAQAGVLYSVSSGDEPGCLMELFDFVNSMGFEVITIGKGKNNPLNPKATPDTVAESARKADKDAFQVASYVDGTKTMFEMACAANATGCKPMRRGMFGPEADLTNISQIFALEEDGGISKFPGAVDFVQGSAMSGGVFVVVRVHNQRIISDLQYLKVGNSNYFTFFRPYHLWFIEAPISLARAYFDKTITLVPLDEPVAESMTVAKRDLKAGDTLDQFGGYTFHGVMDQAHVARGLNALPVGLAPNAKIIKPVADGEIVTWNDVALDENSTVVKLRREQDAL
jgi:predicted homoserine dehydrogenase-like protein